MKCDVMLKGTVWIGEVDERMASNDVEKSLRFPPNRWARAAPLWYNLSVAYFESSISLTCKIAIW